MIRESLKSASVKASILEPFCASKAKFLFRWIHTAGGGIWRLLEMACHTVSWTRQPLRCSLPSQPRNSVGLVCIARKAWLPVAGEVCGGLAGEFRLPLLVARGERGACDPATDVAYCAKEAKFLGFSAGGGDLTRPSRPSAQRAGILAESIGRCRDLVPTGQLKLRHRLRHKVMRNCT